jgi:imidazole glycerol-phosphate synthase subunit HisF
MFRGRVIPVLLIKGRRLVKSVKFKDHRYIGDPLNAARIFNELQADELIVLDIDATPNGELISLDLVRELAEEVTMPFAVGGGITSLENIRALIGLGVEKVVIGTVAGRDPDLIRAAADEFGSSTISVCIDVKKDVVGRDRVCLLGGRETTDLDPIDFAKLMESMGAGELVLQSVDLDGMMSGYDLQLISAISSSVGIPVVALGGAANEADLAAAFGQANASGAAAGSMFVYHGRHRGVLINYPARDSFR